LTACEQRSVDDTTNEDAPKLYQRFATSSGRPVRLLPGSGTTRPALFSAMVPRSPHPLPGTFQALSGRAVGWRVPSAADVAAADPPVCLRPELALQQDQAPDLAAVDPDVGLDVGSRDADGGEVDIE